MRLLFLVQKDQRVILDRLYDAIEEYCDCDLRHLSSAEQADLKTYFKQIDVDAYDRILLFLRVKKEMKQVAFLRGLPHLVFLEHDACQNYGHGKYQGAFSRHYRKLPWVKVLCSGVELAQRLRQETVDAVFIPKGYDQALLYNLERPRDIELAFIGSTQHRAYRDRAEFLAALQIRESVQMITTEPGDDYREKLNHIKFFVSADIGLGEYMIKNFEAMACGCVLFAYDQGPSENAALGLVDMENCVLYRDLDEFCQKLDQLRNNDALVQQISVRASLHVKKHLTWDIVGKKIVAQLECPLRQPEEYPRPLMQRLATWLHIG